MGVPLPSGTTDGPEGPDHRAEPDWPLPRTDRLKGAADGTASRDPGGLPSAVAPARGNEGVRTTRPLPLGGTLCH